MVVIIDDDVVEDSGREADGMGRETHGKLYSECNGAADDSKSKKKRASGAISNRPKPLVEPRQKGTYSQIL